MQVAADFQASVDDHTEELAVVAKAEQIRVDTTSGAVSQTYDVLQVKTLNAAATEVASAIKDLPLNSTRPTWHCSHLRSALFSAMVDEAAMTSLPRLRDSSRT